MKKGLELSIIITVAVAAICIILGVGLILSRTHAMEDELNTRTIELQKEIKEIPQRLDSLPLNTTADIKTAIETIRCNQIVVLHRQDQLVDDFRQEMNNNINKMNTWIAYAIGVMSIVGVFIPVILQIRSHFNEKETMEELNKTKEKLTKEFGEQKKYIQEGLTDFEKEFSDYRNENAQQFKKLIADYKQQFKHLTADYKKKQEYYNLWANFLCFNHGIEDKLLDNIPDRDGIVRHIWCRYIDIFDRFIRSLSDERQIERDMRDKVIIAMVMLNSMLGKIRNHISNRRRFNNATDEIRYILVDIEYGMMNQTSWLMIRKRILLLIEELHKLPIRYDSKGS